jgi:hypothetical protein
MPVHYAFRGAVGVACGPALRSPAAAPAAGPRGSGCDACHTVCGKTPARRLPYCVCSARKHGRIPRRNRAQPQLPERYTRATRRTTY